MDLVTGLVKQEWEGCFRLLYLVKVFRQMLMPAPPCQLDQATPTQGRAQASLALVKTLGSDASRTGFLPSQGASHELS